MNKRQPVFASALVGLAANKKPGKPAGL